MSKVSHYAVLPNGGVYRCAKASDAAAILTAFPATDRDLSQIPLPVLVKLFNSVQPDRPIKRFADRATAERRLEGVLEVLARAPMATPPVEAPPATPPVPKHPPQANTPSAPKTPGDAKRGAKIKAIPQAVVDLVTRMRANGDSWAVIVEALEERPNFQLRMRALLKQRDPSLVRDLGPGSSNYGKRAKRKGRVPRDRGVPMEAF